MTDAEIYSKTISSPAGYATFRLGLSLHATQKKVLDSLFAKEKTRLSFLCGNGVGKTSHVVVAAILYAIEILNATCISTAMVYRQIAGQLVPSLKQFSHLYPRNWAFNENAISIDGIDRYLGFATDDEGRWQGWHAHPGRPLLIIVDEAAGIKETVFQAIDRCQPTYLLIVGSPLGPEGHFYKIETDPKLYSKYAHYKLTQPQCPWIPKREWGEMIATWGEEHPLVKSSVYGDFHLDVENAIISLKAVDNCLKNPPQSSVNALSDMRVGLDFAVEGDETVIAMCHGNEVSIVNAWREKDTMASVDIIKKELDNLRLCYGLKASQVVGDASGLGRPIIDCLRRFGWPINDFYGQAKPFDEHYNNAITEAWLSGAHKIMNCKVRLPNDNLLKMQMLSRKQKLNMSGKLQLESKSDMRKRNVPSPDRADAVFMAMARCNMYGADRPIIPVSVHSPSKRVYSF